MDALGVIRVDGILLNQVILDDDSVAELSHPNFDLVNLPRRERERGRESVLTLSRSAVFLCRLFLCASVMTL